MSELISVIVALIIIGVLVWAARQLINLIPMDPWIKQVVNVLIIVALVLAIVVYVLLPLLSSFGAHLHLPAVK